jgi:hypothetical protein
VSDSQFVVVFRGPALYTLPNLDNVPKHSQLISINKVIRNDEEWFFRRLENKKAVAEPPSS